MELQTNIVNKNFQSCFADLEKEYDQKLRQKAVQSFNPDDLFSGKSEEWKYISWKGLKSVHFQKITTRTTKSQLENRESVAEKYKEHFVERAINIPVIDGVPYLLAKEVQKLSEGWDFYWAADLEKHEPEYYQSFLEALGVSKLIEQQNFWALNQAVHTQALLLRLRKGQAGGLPIHLIYDHSDRQNSEQVANEVNDVGFVHCPRVLLELQQSSCAKLWETYLYQDSADSGKTNDLYLNVHSLMIRLNAGANLSHFIRQYRNSDQQVSQVKICQEDGSHYSCFQFFAGSPILRHRIDIEQKGTHAESRLQGVYLGSDVHTVDQFVNMTHEGTHGKSSQYFKGIFKDRSKGVFQGTIRVLQDAQKTEARQLNKNLLLSSDAEANSKPQLEIHADDIKCSHGATVSRPRMEELFYLASRGIAPEKREKILCNGFINELVLAIEDQQSRDFILRLIDHENYL